MSFAAASVTILKMRRGVFLSIFFLFLFTSQSSAGAGQGYADTVIWWEGVRGQIAQYRVILQNLYAEVEATQGRDRSRTNAEFARRLARDYPGSNYIGGYSGYLAVNNYTTIFFDSSWNISQLKQKFGSLEKAYDFRNKTFTVSDGPNRIALRIDPANPGASVFTSATVPAITVNAEQVWARRTPPANSQSPLKDLLNDTYSHILAGKGMRMDKLAEELVTNAASRDYLLQAAGTLYAGKIGGKGGVGKPLPSQTSPVINLPTASTLTSSIFKIIPWYAYLLFALPIVLKILTPRPKKWEILELLLRQLMSSKRPQQDRYDDWHHESDDSEDWLGHKSNQHQGGNGMPKPNERPVKWTQQVLSSLEWKRFETVCAEYFRMTGYEPKETRIGADGGVDIWVYKPGSEKPFGIVQCKAWTTYKVGIKPVRELFGVMAAEGVVNGMFITSGEFTSEALAFAEGKKLRLISGKNFLDFIGKLPAEKQKELLSLATEGDYRTPTCPQCGIKMRLREGKGSGRDFWGCLKYPRCKATLVYKAEAV